MSTPIWKPQTDLAARLLGLGFATAGAAILYWQIVVTLERAAEHESEIPYSLKLIALGEMAAVFGLYWIATGLAGYTKIIGLQKDRRFLWGLGIGAFVAILLTDYLISQQLAALGYAT